MRIEDDRDVANAIRKAVQDLKDAHAAAKARGLLVKFNYPSTTLFNPGELEVAWIERHVSL
jgi:hypothetical protein